ncbi:hypothetical protein DFH11DRAFT_1563932 [Phellopilus nigrolimitatus]|nr:hypothetical protein DFH11DRAFT_1563932 [Phellopilus nigrolimitatus]
MMDNLQPRGPFVFDAVESIVSLQYLCLAAIVVLYYDHIITFHLEIKQIWRQKFSLSSYIFILNRYLTFFGYIPIVYFLFNSPDNDKVCTAFARIPGSLSTTTQCIIAVLLVMRVYALYRGNLWVLLVTIALGILTMIGAAWSVSQLKTTNLSFGPESEFRACVPSGLVSNISFKFSWLSNLLFDTTVFLLTVSKTYKMCKEHRHIGIQSPLVFLLMRDGSMFYAVLAAANLINFLLFLRKENRFPEESAGNNSMLTHTISVTLTSRMILNLREAGSQTGTNPTGFSGRYNSETGFRGESFMMVSTSTFSNTTPNPKSSGRLAIAETTASDSVGRGTRSQDAHV